MNIELEKLRKEFQKDVEEAVLGTYPEDIFPSVPDSARARDNVLATAMRDMKGAISHIAGDSFDGFAEKIFLAGKESGKKEIEEGLDEVIEGLKGLSSGMKETSTLLKARTEPI